MSELVSAQLISSSSFVRQHQIPVIAGLGHVMSLEPEELEHNLNVLFECDQLDNKQLQRIWAFGLDEGMIKNLMQYAEQHQWSLPKKRPLHMIDHPFGPTGEFIFPASPAMLSGAVKETEQNHLITYQSAQYAQKKSLCLITRKLYLRTRGKIMHTQRYSFWGYLTLIIGLAGICALLVIISQDVPIKSGVSARLI